LIVEEANAIGTAYLRLDLVPGDARVEYLPIPGCCWCRH
jgi:hypothetical protein